MKINHKLLSVGALSLLLGFTACNNDDDKGSSQLSKADAKTEISAFNSGAKADLQELANTAGLKAVQDFFALVEQDDPFGRVGTDRKKIRTFLREKGREFKSVFAPESLTKGRTSADGAFDFEGNTGVYAWNEDENIFEKTGESAIIKIQFPTEGSSSNNAELQLTAYEEIEVYDEEFEETYYEPALLRASVYVDEVKKASLDLQVEYDGAGFPVQADLSLMVSPYTASLSIDASSSTSSSVSVFLKKAQDVIIGTALTVKYADQSKSEESLKSLEGYVQFKNLKVQGSVDLTSTSTNLNDFVKLTLLANNKKAGDILFETVDQQEIPFVKYADGTKEKLEDVLKPVVDEINALSEDLSING